MDIFDKHPDLKIPLRVAISDHVSSFRGKWDLYIYLQSVQDAWSDPIDKLDLKDQKILNDHFEAEGEFPTQEVINLFSEVEREVFGKTVEEEL